LSLQAKDAFETWQKAGFISFSPTAKKRRLMSHRIRPQAAAVRRSVDNLSKISSLRIYMGNFYLQFALGGSMFVLRQFKKKNSVLA
jgi:hypothetical protein